MNFTEEKLAQVIVELVQSCKYRAIVLGINI